MNRTEVLERIAPISDTRVRTMEATPRTRIVVTPDMVTLRPGGGARILELHPDGVKAMAKFNSIPVDLAKEITPDLFGRLNSELLYRKGRYNVLLKDGAVVDFTKPSHFPPINPERLLRTIEANIGNAEYNRAFVIDHGVDIEVVGQRQHAVIPGDLVRGGALVTFSPIGTVAPAVQSFALRLICTNGAAANDVVRRFEYGGGEGDEIWQWFRESLREAYNSINRIVSQWRRLSGERIPAEDRSMVLEAMLRRTRLNKEAIEAVRAEALAHPPETSYDILNLITWATSHVLTQPRQIQQARTAAADFAGEETHQRICPVCHHTR